jgi:hypothetical protein
MTATCFGFSYGAIFRLSPKNCYIQLTMFLEYEISFTCFIYIYTNIL